MTTNLAKIAVCAGKIFELVGPCDRGTPKLALSGRSPNFPEVALEDLVSPSDYNNLDTAKRLRLSGAVQSAMAALREMSLSQYWHTAQQLYSPGQIGLPDLDVELRLCAMYEARYNRSLEDIRRMLVKLLAPCSSDTDYRNTRGGFGDVSHFLQLPANNPSETS